MNLRAAVLEVMGATEVNAQQIAKALSCGKRGCRCGRRSGKELLTHCPAHADDKPSLTITEDDGRLLVRCHAGCSQAAVLAALQARSLWPENSRRDGRSEIIATYVYRDEGGSPLSEVCRTADKRFLQRRPGAKAWGIAGVRRVPYRLPDLLAADPETSVFVCEGEKDTDHLASLGLVATTNPRGAGKWRDEYSTHLRDRKVVIIPDNDQPGREHAAQVAASLRGVAAQVTVLTLPDLAAKGDVSDWLDAGGTAEDLLDMADRVNGDKPRLDVKAALEGLQEGNRSDTFARVTGKLHRAGMAAEEITVILTPYAERVSFSLDELQAEVEGITTRYPRPEPPATVPEGTPDTDGPVLVNLADVTPEPVRWQWYPYLPLGKLTIVEGDPEAGKSFLSLAIAPAVTTGGVLPGGEALEPANVLLLTAEDGLSDTVRPRLDEMGAAVSRVTVLRAVRRGDKERQFSLAEDLLHPENAITETRPVYVSIDPLTAYMGKGTNTWQDSEVRGILGPLATLAERFAVAVSGVGHLTKTGRDRALYRGQNSIAFPAAARSVLLVAESQDVDELRIVAQIKCNLVPHGPSLGFRLDGGRFGWVGEVDADPESLLDRRSGGGIQEAEAFLRGFLDGGPRLAAEGDKKAADAGISERTLKRAKKSLGVRSERQGSLGTEGEWLWVLEEGR